MKPKPKKMDWKIELIIETAIKTAKAPFVCEVYRPTGTYDDVIGAVIKNPTCYVSHYSIGGGDTLNFVVIEKGIIFKKVVVLMVGVEHSDKTADMVIIHLVDKTVIYNTPQKLDRGIRCMLACHNREGGMARCVTCGEDMMLLLRPRSHWKL